MGPATFKCNEANLKMIHPSDDFHVKYRVRIPLITVFVKCPRWKASRLKVELIYVYCVGHNTHTHTHTHTNTHTHISICLLILIHVYITYTAMTYCTEPRKYVYFSLDYRRAQTHKHTHTDGSRLRLRGHVDRNMSATWCDDDWWLVFYGHFCAHGRLNGPSDLQR